MHGAEEGEKEGLVQVDVFVGYADDDPTDVREGVSKTNVIGIGGGGAAGALRRGGSDGERVVALEQGAEAWQMLRGADDDRMPDEGHEGMAKGARGGGEREERGQVGAGEGQGGVGW